jgi:uncharacterized protein (UPF0333 family)
MRLSLPRRGQLSVEFFLILSIVIAFSIILYNISLEELGKTRASNAVVSTKSVLDSLSNSADFVALSGNGSVVKRVLFVPKEAKCLYYDPNGRTLYCVIADEWLEQISAKRVVNGTRLITPNQLIIACGVPLKAGWAEFTVNSSSNFVKINCKGA